MSKIKFVSVFVLLALLLSAGIGAAMSQNSPPVQDNMCATVAQRPLDADFQPGVQEFIADTYLAHTTEYPDPNEPVELLRLYLEGRQLLRKGRVEEAVEIFTQAVTEYPQCRHAHAGLGTALWQRYQSAPVESTLRSAVEEFVLAAEIGLGYGKVRYTHRIAESLAQLGEAKKIDEFFFRALQVGDRSYLTHLHYGQALAWLNDDRAEKWYQKAIGIQPEGNFDAQAHYAEWLLDQGREEDVLQLLEAQQSAYYLRFLRGVALERVERVDEASLDYTYSADFTRDFPVPARYRIERS
ncbi:MAG: hypothetical protein K8R89_01460, partial [Anaerolineae bacterium]|nr:hypothetical protein [Anaerolineae bacterium]